MRSITSLPSNNSERLNIALSIAIIILFSCAKVLLLPQKCTKNNVKKPKYHTHGIWNAPLVGLWERGKRRTFAPRIINHIKSRIMKTINRMRMREYCCCQMMMAMTMKGSVYIIIGNEQLKQNGYEKDSNYNSIGFKPGTEQRLGRG
jgi:hypothetical protein